jgi:hypothetical protein
VIDGRYGENFVHALEIYEKAKGLKVKKGLDDSGRRVEGPFFPNLPKDYDELAKLKTIGYRNPSQKIGAVPHGEDLLAGLNPARRLAPRAAGQRSNRY